MREHPGGEPAAATVRRATRADLAAIVSLLADDPLGRERERPLDPLPARYELAFDAIARDENHALVVAERDGAVVGTLQFSVLPSLTYEGRARAQIEAVRVAAGARNDGVGRTLVEWAINEAGRRGCHLVQLTSDKRRPSAIVFYERLGFRPTHEGMKLWLNERP